MSKMFNLEKVKRAHQRFLAEHSRAVDEALDAEKLRPWAWRYVSQHGGFKSRTGNLVHKTDVKLIRRGKTRIVRSSNNAKYAAAQDGGSGLFGPRHAKYIIRARRRQALTFVSRGKLVFAHSVMHPGVRPTRFLYNVNDAMFRATKQWLRAAMAKAASKF